MHREPFKIVKNESQIVQNCKQEHRRADANTRLWVQFWTRGWSCGCLDFVFLTFEYLTFIDLFTTQNVQVHEIHMKKKTFDLEGWPWPFTTQNVQLYEIHMHAKYQVAIFNIAKVMTNVRVFRQTHRRTDRQTDSSTAICHPTGGIKTF